MQQQFQINKQSINESAILSANNLSNVGIQCMYTTKQSLISVEFVAKLKMLVFQLQEQHQKHAFLSSILSIDKSF